MEFVRAVKAITFNYKKSAAPDLLKIGCGWLGCMQKDDVWLSLRFLDMERYAIIARFVNANLVSGGCDS